MGVPIMMVEQVESMIHVVRGLRVILDEDIAALYEVDTGSLVRAVHRNRERFPDDFVFRLTEMELAEVRASQGANRRRGGRRNLPIAFTEQEWPCCRAFFAVSVPFMSTLKWSEHSFV